MSLVGIPDSERLNASATALSRALATLTQGTSSAPAPGAALPKRERVLATLRKRADEARTQQLRGVFAAFDEDRDGLLLPGELKGALLALGVDPTPPTLARFSSASTLPSKGIDFAAVRTPFGCALAQEPVALTPARTATPSVSFYTSTFYPMAGRRCRARTLRLSHFSLNSTLRGQARCR